MKTRYLLILLLCIIASTLNAQWINSMTMSPANPTTTDTIYVYVDCSFPSGTCDQHTQTLYGNQPFIYGQATHCLGMLAVICDASDTFKINPLVAGSYSFVFNLNVGALPSPCTPGFGPGVSDTVFFNVSNASSIPEIDNGSFQFTLFPNPVKEQLHLNCNDASIISKNNSLIIYSLTGQELFSSKISSKEMLVDISEIPHGIYMCRISGEGVNEKHWIEIIQ